VWPECGQRPSSDQLTRAKKKSHPHVEAREWDSGPDRRRSGDLSIFSRTLYQLSYRALRTGPHQELATCTVLFLIDRKPLLSKRLYCFATLTGLEPATSAVTGRRANQLRYRAKLFSSDVCDPNGIRTRVNAVKGRRPRPLNDGAAAFRTP
jgi:hypothetical protein